MLAQTGHERKWTLIPELSLKHNGKLIKPDGTLRDEWFLPRGYWEAKDTHDDLDAEIKKKAAKGYPLTNTIFEDTRNAVLYQNGAECFRVPMRDKGKLADLLTLFYAHTTPDYQGFNEAVSAFKERIPQLAEGLKDKIVTAHKKNKKFIEAFADFMELCKTSLNPNIRVEAVDEMLVQHLLTERLFRTIFQNADFTRRNVIAVEIERVIDALTSSSFSRAEFLKSLDPFYLAIESTAGTIEDFSQKQHFLNTVYERFFQGYSVKVADTHGIVYTPQEIVGSHPASHNKWDIFHYVYGVLHQPEYRTTFADNLKRELPRIPFMADFEAFADAGRRLAALHLDYETLEPWPLAWVETPGVPLSYEVAKMKLSKDGTTLKVNDSLTLAGIPPEVVRYRLGNRSALAWVVDQYQVSEDARSGIRSDPNRADDPEYIVRLVGQVVRVSVETVKIVESLPTGIGDPL